MNRLLNKSAISFGALGVALLVVVLAAFFIISGVTHAGSEKPVSGGRILTIYDRGSEKRFVSQAATIGDALKEAGVSINEKDVVEPSLTQKMIASDYKVNIYRARPVVIIDGNMRTKIITAFQTPEQIAAEAGIKMFDEDKATLSLSDDIVADGAGLKLTIIRATSFTFTLYGKVMTARTFSKTVGEMLTEKGIKLTASDKVTPEIGTLISEGLAIRVWREGKDIVNVDEAINFDTDVIEDIDQPVGYHIIRTAGEQGSRSVSYEITVQDGVEVGRSEIASITTKLPKEQIEVVGAKLPPVSGPKDIIERIKYWSNLRGLDAEKVVRIAQCESTFNPNAVNYNYYNNGNPTGLFQHISGYWPNRAIKYGVPGASIYDIEAQIKVTTGMMADDGYGAWECR